MAVAKRLEVKLESNVLDNVEWYILMSKNIKISDIAKSLGISTATVSRALSGSDRVTQATKDKVKQEADRLHYRPNLAARNLRIQKSMAILLVVRDMSNPFYLEVFKGVEGIARRAGYSVLMGNTEGDVERENEYFNMLADGHVDGMILMTGKLPAKHKLLEMPASETSIVIALEKIKDCNLRRVIIDNEAAAEVATQHLIDLGHKKIAHIAGPEHEPMSMLRTKGYRNALKAAKLLSTEKLEYIGDYSLESGKAACHKLFSNAQDYPTALFVANDEMAFGVINELRKIGLDVPQDVSVVGFDNLSFSGSFYPPLTTISQPRIDIGKQAMHMLLNVMNGKIDTAVDMRMPTNLKIRSSTRQLNICDNSEVKND